MKAIGRITELCGDKAYVVSKRSSACASCHECTAKGSCHAELVFGNGHDEVCVLVDNSIGANVGDTVELESSTAGTLLMCFLAFVFPVTVSALIYLLLNKVLSNSNVLPLLMIAVFVICFVVSVFILNCFIKKKASAVIVRIIEERK